MNPKKNTKYLLNSLTLLNLFLIILSFLTVPSFALSATGSQGGIRCLNEKGCGTNEVCVNGFCVKLSTYNNDEYWSDDFVVGCGFGYGLGKTCHWFKTSIYKGTQETSAGFYMRHGPTPYFDKTTSFCDPETNIDCNFSTATELYSGERISSIPMFYPLWGHTSLSMFLFYEIENISTFELASKDEDHPEYYVSAFRPESLNESSEYHINFLIKCNNNSTISLLLGYLAKDLGIDTGYSYFSAVPFRSFNISYNFTNLEDRFGPWVKVNLSFSVSLPVGISVVFSEPNPSDSVCIIKDFTISKLDSNIEVIPVYDKNFFESPIKRYNKVSLNSEDVIIHKVGVNVYSAEALLYNKSRTGLCRENQCYVGHCVDSGTIVGFFDNQRFGMVCDNGIIMPYVKAYNPTFTKETFCPRLGCLNESDQCVDAFTANLEDEKICFAGKWYDANVFVASLMPSLLKPFDFRDGIDSNAISFFCTHEMPEVISHSNSYIDNEYLRNVAFYCQYLYYNSSDDFDSVLAYFKNSTEFPYFGNPPTGPTGYSFESWLGLDSGAWMYVYSTWGKGLVYGRNIPINDKTFGFKRFYDPNYLVENNYFYFYILHNLPYELFSDEDLNLSLLSFTKYLPIALYKEDYDLDSDDGWIALNSTLQFLIDDMHLKDLVDYNFARYENNPYFKTTYTIMAILDSFDNLINKYVNLSDESIATQIISNFNNSGEMPYLFGKLKLHDIRDFGVMTSKEGFASDAFFIDFKSIIIYDDYNIQRFGSPDDTLLSLIYVNSTNFCDVLNKTIQNLFSGHAGSQNIKLFYLDEDHKSCLVNWADLSSKNVSSGAIVSWMYQISFRNPILEFT